MKKNKTSNRQKAGYKRKDLRKGGRVKHARGDEVTDNNYTQAIDGSGKIKRPQERTGRGEDEAGQILNPTPAPTPAPKTPEQIEADKKAAEDKAAADAEAARLEAERVAKLSAEEKAAEAKAAADTEAAKKAAELRNLTDVEKDEKFLAERKARMNETGEQAQAIAAGNVPDTLPKVPLPPGIDKTDTLATPEQIEELQIKGASAATAAEVAVPTLEDAEVVSTVTNAAKALRTEDYDFEAAQVPDATKVTEAEIITAATGEVSPEVADTLAEAAGVKSVNPIEATEVQIVEGALQERVIGTISPEAKAVAAKVAGTTLAKITRAKKQLRKAGLNEEDIIALGNNPEALEDRLTDFTEAERGVIEGLPEEALISNQIDTLLNSIEEGTVPMWAKPAVASVEAMLAKRGMSASTVGRDALLNAIITSALPIAQGNAQAIQASVNQQRSIEATNALKDAEMAQQTAMFNSQNVFQMDMAQFSADQQKAINNSKFLQTVSLTNASNTQQAALQNAVLMSQRNLAEADQNTKFAIQNAQSFLQMDLSNLNNEQQANVLSGQLNQQRMLSNAAADNAAKQFNATSINQTNQFMGNLDASIAQFNAQQHNAIQQFNKQQENSAEARRVQNNFEAAKLDAQLQTQVSQFNEQQNFNREQFNVKNATAIAQSNLAWRRQANTADTAAINAVNQQNAQNAYGLSVAAQNFLWQELRDEADFTFKRWDNEEQRKTSLLVAALGNEGGTNRKDHWASNLEAITNLADGWLDNT
jgi:hypothetical protein|tara:strand:+ start:479 stop:2764 length:2286 start_codon:yes stop_codon:yes gene_type:complete